MKLPFDKIYCIHLAEREDRYQNMKSEYERLGISEQVEFWWTCKREISNKVGDFLTELHTDVYDHCRQNNERLYGSVFNCSLEHYTVVKQAYLRGFNKILIMEDDVNFIDDLNKIEHFFTTIPDDCDICKIYHRGNGKIDKFKTQYDEFQKLEGDFVELKKFNEGIFSTEIYYLNRKGMESYIKALDYKFTPADITFKTIMELCPDCKIYLPKETINVFNVSSYMSNIF